MLFYKYERSENIMNERLAAIRKALDLSMEKFGAKIGVSRSAISKMESGSSGLSEQTILSICREFRVNYHWLTEGVGEMFIGTPQSVIDEIADDYDLDDHDKKILEKYLSLTPDQRRVLRNFLKDMFA